MGSQTPDADQAPPRVRMAMLIRGVPTSIREQPKEVIRDRGMRVSFKISLLLPVSSCRVNFIVFINGKIVFNAGQKTVAVPNLSTVAGGSRGVPADRYIYRHFETRRTKTVPILRCVPWYISARISWRPVSDVWRDPSANVDSVSSVRLELRSDLVLCVYGHNTRNWRREWDSNPRYPFE